MDYRFIANNDPADEDLIKELETNLGCSLPDDYRTFLLTYNGPYHEPLDPDDDPDRLIGFEAQPSPPAPAEFWSIDIFPAVSRAEGSYTIYNLYKAGLDWNHLKELLPIVRLHGHGRVFLCVNGPQKGGVFMVGDKWLEKYNQSETITIDDYQKITASFTDFLSMIKLKPEKKADIELPAQPPAAIQTANENPAIKIIAGLSLLAFPLYAGFAHLSLLILPLLAISFTYAYITPKFSLFKNSLRNDGVLVVAKHLIITYVTQLVMVGVFYLLSLGIAALITDIPEINPPFGEKEAIVVGLSLITVISTGIFYRRSK